MLVVAPGVKLVRAAMRAVGVERVMVPTRALAWSGDTGMAECAALDTTSFPYGTADLLLVYADTGFSSGVWELADAPSTVDAVEAVGAGMYFARLPGAVAEVWGTGSCDWASWSAVNDVVERRRPPGGLPELETVGVLATQAADLDDLQPCHYRWLAERVRKEADEHDDAGAGIVRAVIFDEPWRLMDGPETRRWQAWTDCDATLSSKVNASRWSADDFAEVAEQFRSGTYTIPTGDGSACAADTGSPPSGCDTDTGSTVIGGSDVEVWLRMLDVSVPRYVVPSVVMGVPGDPSSSWPPSGSSTCTASYSFCEGDEVYATWTGLREPAGIGLFSQVVVEYFYSTPESEQPLDLRAVVNGTTVPPQLYDDGTGAWTTLADASLASTSPYQVVQRRHCLLGCGGAATWVTGAPNTVRLEVEPTDVDPTTVDSTPEHLDRIVYAWGVRVRFLDGAGVEVGTLLLTPTAATVGYAMVPWSGRSTPVVWATDNADWLLSGSVDAVVIAMNNTQGLGEDLSAMGIDPHVAYFSAHAYRGFVKDTCNTVRNLWGLGCYVDVLGADSSGLIYDAVTVGAVDYPRAPLSVWKARMEAADLYADGIVANFLPVDDPNAGSEAGRWAWKAALPCADTGCVLGADTGVVELVEQRRTTLYAGAHEEFRATLVDTDAGCEGLYQVDVDVRAPTLSPDLHWWVYRYDGVKNYYRGDGYATQDYVAAMGSHADVDFWAYLGDTIRMFWVSEGGGGSPTTSTRARFRVTPPKAGCAIDWSHASSVDTGYRTMEEDTAGVFYPGWHAFATTPAELYDCITGYWAGTPGVCP